MTQICLKPCKITKITCLTKVDPFDLITWANAVSIRDDDLNFVKLTPIKRRGNIDFQGHSK